MRQNTCCFAGQRSLPSNGMERMITGLNNAMETLILQGVTNFISAGSFGFDLVAASLVIAKKELGRDMKLIFALPNRKQEKARTEEQSWLYRNLLNDADEIRYVSSNYSMEGLKAQDCYMVDQSAYCICYMSQFWGDTFDTVEYARNTGVRIVNVAQREVLIFKSR